MRLLLYCVAVNSSPNDFTNKLCCLDSRDMRWSTKSRGAERPCTKDHDENAQ